MSFTREVIEIVNENEVLDGKKLIITLLSKLTHYQSKIRNYVERCYVEFLSDLTSNALYLEEGEKLSAEVEELLRSIENDNKPDLCAAAKELQQYVEELKEVSLGFSTCYKILKIDHLFHLLDASKTDKKYVETMEIISNIKTLIDDPKDKILHRIDCFENIKIKYLMESEMLLHNLKQCFEKLVQLSEKSFKKTKVVTIKIENDERMLRDTIVALFNAKYNPRKLCDFLLNNVFEPIITKPVSLERGETDSKLIEISVSYSLKPLEENLRPNYKTVFRNIEEIFLCLLPLNISLSPGISVFTIFGDNIKQQFITLLINECLMNSIPDTIDEMDGSSLIADVNKLHAYLVDIQFLNSQQDVNLVSFTNKIETLFRNRFCTKVLDRAIEIMRKDLHDMTLVAENSSTSDTSNPYTFPRCMISKNILELINLMEEITRQASTSEDITGRLIATIPTILNRYIVETPRYHENFLQNIPQQTALFHNNCMFLSNWVAKTANEIESCAKIVKLLQSLGSEHFVHQVQNQRSNLFEILQELDLSGDKTELGIGPQRVVRQCLRQLDLLKNVWQTILPDVVYCKTMGSLLNDFCVEVIRRVISLEDIPSTTANDLAEICTILIERAPSIFQDPLEIKIKVKSWMKLLQLKTILEGSLAQITEQWAEGKGPLTLNFKAEEIKHLVRALFQNTDRRANALALII